MPANNVLWIAVDDFAMTRWIEDYCGLPLHTPNLDALYAQSVVFDNAVCIQTICSPSRAAICTGLTPAESMIVMNDQDLTRMIDLRRTIQNRVMRAGAYVWSSGKIFHSSHANLIRRYCQHNDTIVSTDSYDFTGATYGAYWESVGIAGAQAEQSRDWKIAQSFIDWIGGWSDDRPFFAQVGFNHPHVPYHAPQAYFDLYDPNDITFPAEWLTDTANIPEYARLYISDNHYLPENDEAAWRSKIHGYAACVSHFDYQLGRVMAALDASPYGADTVVMLWSDHGYANGDHDTNRKHALWDQITRIPMCIRYPGISARVETGAVSTIDIPNTTAAVFGLPYAGRYGRDLTPMLQLDAGWVDRPALTMWQGAASIITADGSTRYTLYPSGEAERFDLTTDPACATNIAGVGDDSALRAQLVEQCALAGYNLMTQTYVGDAGHGAWIVPDDVDVAMTGGAGNGQYYVTRDYQVTELGNGGYDTLWMASYPEDSNGLIHVPDNFERLEDAVKNHFNLPSGMPIRALLNDSGMLVNIFSMYGQIDGGRGADTINVQTAFTIMGGGGDDVITGAYGALNVSGGAGRDTITGSTQADTLDGGSGDDTIRGLGGNDKITVRGGDVVYGGAGNDVFTVHRNSRAAVIKDFTTGDQIIWTGWTPVLTQDGANVLASLGRSLVVLEGATVANVSAASSYG